MEKLCWRIRLERRTKNRINPEITQRKLKSLAKVCEQNPSLGFEGKVSKLQEPERVFDDVAQEAMYVYRSKILVQTYQVSDAATQETMFNRHILEPLRKQAETEGWKVLSEPIIATTNVPSLSGNGAAFEIPVSAMDESDESRPMFELPELNENAYQQFFAGVYERDAHIRMIHDSMKAYVRSGGEQRSHVLLEGRPACCKTILLERFKAFYEHDAPEGVERVAFIDGPTMSKAGLENWLMELAIAGKLPEIICIEEIEKQNMDNLLTLLSVMGSGYIMKTNARIGRLKQLAKCVIWATCNDKNLLKRFREGALWSRFTHKFHCKRPSPELMSKIVRDKVAKTDGDPRWAEAVIKFSYDEVVNVTGKPIVDPRAILGLLDGGDRLLDGSYQADYLETLSREDEDEPESAFPARPCENFGASSRPLFIRNSEF